MRARIVGIQRFYGVDSHWRIVVKLEAVEAGGTAVPLLAAAERTPFPKAVGRSRLRGQDLGTMRDLEDSAFAVFRVPGKNRIVKKGLKTEWVTAAPKPDR